MLFSKVFIEKNTSSFVHCCFVIDCPFSLSICSGCLLWARVCVLCFTQMCQKVHKDVRVFLHAV